MKQSCDPYYEWLGIPPKDQPPNHYRLLGLENFEDNRDVIATAADRQMSFVKTYQAGENSELSQRILNELATARICLLNPDKKSEYDETLHADLDLEAEPEVVAAEVVPEPASLAPVAAFATPQPPVPVAMPATPAGRSEGLNIRAIVLGAAGVLACVICGLLIGLAILWLRGPSNEAPSIVAQADPPARDQPSRFAELPDPSAESPATLSDESANSGLIQTAAHYEELPAAPSTPAMTPGDMQLDDASPSAPSGQIEEPPSDSQEADEYVPEETQHPTVEAHAEEDSSTASTDASVPTPETASAKLSIPDMAEQQQARQQIAELYDLDPLSPVVKTAQQRLDFMRLAADPKESPAVRFALLRTVAESAVFDHDHTTSFETVDRMAEFFEVNAPEAKAALLYQILGDGEELSCVFEFLKGCEQLIIEAADEGNFALADRLSASADQLSDKPVGGSDFRQGLKSLRTEVVWLHGQSQLAAQANAILSANPNDAAACATAGRWHCFVRSNWQEGLALLARSDDSTLSEIALREQSQSPLTSAQQMDLAEAWRDYARSGPPPYRYASLARACHWCQSLDLNSLGGLDRTRVQQLQLQLDNEMNAVAPQCRLIATGAQGPVTADGGDIAGSQDAPTLFQRGLLAATQEHDYETAERLFRRCTELAPENVAAMNNCALASMRCGNLRGALHMMISAAEISPQSSELAHNLNQLTRLADAGHLAFDASTRKDISELQATLASSPSPGAGFGFLYMPLNQASGGSGGLLDQACIYCAGRGQVECPARGCSRGTVGSTRTDVVGRNPVTGQVIVKNTPIRVPCGRCGGRGQVDCPHCSHGMMRSF